MLIGCVECVEQVPLAAIVVQEWIGSSGCRTRYGCPVQVVNFVGELSNAALLAVHHSKIVSWVLIFSASAALSLCFCTPSLMYPISTALMAFANVVQLTCSSGIFSLKTSGKLSHSMGIDVLSPVLLHCSQVLHLYPHLC